MMLWQFVIVYKHVCKCAGHAGTWKIIKKKFYNKYSIILYNLSIILTGFFSRIRFCNFRVTIRRVTIVFDVFYDILLEF